MTIKIISNDNGNPPGKLADVELHWRDRRTIGLRGAHTREAAHHVCERTD